MHVLRGLLNRFRNTLSRHDDKDVVEPDPRVVMAVLAIGVIVGALISTSPSAAPPTAADASVVETGR